MEIIQYNRRAAVEYARKWAFSRNPAYYDFSRIGGDCTSFASQCLFAGCGVMNYTPDIGWFYRSLNDRAAAWTGVEYFYRFLTGNVGDYLQNPTAKIPLGVIGNGAGPFAVEAPLQQLEIGDFVQLGRGTDDYYHTPIIVGFRGNTPLVAAHTNDAYNRSLSTYSFEKVRGIHILGARMP